MARHRSPSGARPESRPDTSPGVPDAEAGSRFPAPPARPLCVRATVVAAAGGALVAAGQTVATALGMSAAPTAEESYARLAASAMLPVSETRTGDPTAPAVTSAIGGEQLSSTGSVPALDPGATVDVANLTKAARLGEKAAAENQTKGAALAHGAPQAVVYDGAPYTLPTRGRFTSGFGGRWGVTHYGIDLAAPIGTPIYALTDGVVEKAGPASGFGMWVVLRHPDGTSSVYGHINRAFVEAGQEVRAGDEIAEVGNRGQSTGPHLHLEVWEPDGTKVNPLPWLSERGLDVTGPAKAEAESEAESGSSPDSDA